MKMHGTWLRRTFVLEAYKLGARIAEIHVQMRSRIYAEEKVKTRHVRHSSSLERPNLLILNGWFRIETSVKRGNKSIMQDETSDNK